MYINIRIFGKDSRYAARTRAFDGRHMKSASFVLMLWMYMFVACLCGLFVMLMLRYFAVNTNFIFAGVSSIRFTWRAFSEFSAFIVLLPLLDSACERISMAVYVRGAVPVVIENKSMWHHAHTYIRTQI